MENNYVSEATQGPHSIDLKAYYLAQTGGAIDPYVSYYHLPQRGRGFFGRILKGSILPIIRSVMPYLKDKALGGVEGLVTDMKSGMSIKEAGSRQLKRTASQVMDDVVTKIKQRGSGVRKRQSRRKRSYKRKGPARKGTRRRGVKRGRKTKRSRTKSRGRKTRKVVLFA